ncbi:MAG: hypothetical protein ACLVKO_01725 [Dysgonomonas sp.]
MKKILYILFAVCLFTACSSDDDDNNGGGQTQNKTSYVLKQTYRDIQPNTVVGYKKSNIYVQLAQYGDLKKDVLSKEVTIESNDITEIFIFYTDQSGTYRIDDTFKIEKDKKNIIELKGEQSIILVDKDNSTQYPINPY